MWWTCSAASHLRRPQSTDRVTMNAWPSPLQVPVPGETRTIQAFAGGSGSPTVVFEAGLGCHSAYWGDLPARVAAITSVVAYDRAGLGGSEPRKKPATPAAFAADLAAVLEAAGALTPYVLVGHSFGGFLIRGFAVRYPEVGALMFVDSSTENEMDGLSERVKQREKWAGVALKINIFAARLGIGRLGFVRKQTQKTYPRYAQAIVDSIATQVGTPRHWQTNLEELKAYPAVAADVRESRGNEIFKRVPITVVTAVEYPDQALKVFEKSRGEFHEFHMRRQHDALASLSPASRHVVAGRSGHFVQHDEPDLLFSEIEALVHQVRSGEGSAKR